MGGAQSPLGMCLPDPPCPSRIPSSATGRGARGLTLQLTQASLCSQRRGQGGSGAARGQKIAPKPALARAFPDPKPSRRLLEKPGPGAHAGPFQLHPAVGGVRPVSAPSPPAAARVPRAGPGKVTWRVPPALVLGWGMAFAVSGLFFQLYTFFLFLFWPQERPAVFPSGFWL